MKLTKNEQNIYKNEIKQNKIKQRDKKKMKKIENYEHELRKVH